MASSVRVIKDWRKYVKAVELDTTKILDQTAEEVKRAQWRTLVANIKDWSGNLALSLRIRTPNAKSRAIGPNQSIAPYAGYIEEGLGGFQGYHYVSNSTRAVQMQFMNLIKRSLERS